MRAHLPPGSFLVQEQYTPIVGPDRCSPPAAPASPPASRSKSSATPATTSCFLSSQAYDRFLHPENLEDLANAEVARAATARSSPTGRWSSEWTPGRFQDGPELRLYQTDPEPVVYATEVTFRAEDALVSDPEMRVEGAEEIIFTKEGQWALFKGYLAAGTYTATVDPQPASPDDPYTVARLRLTNRQNEPLAQRLLLASNPATVADIPSRPGALLDLSRSAKIFVYLELAPGLPIHELTIASAAE